MFMNSILYICFWEGLIQLIWKFEILLEDVNARHVKLKVPWSSQWWENKFGYKYIFLIDLTSKWNIHVHSFYSKAFDTPTGMPYGTVNLRYGVPEGETTITCTAGVGTFLIEFGTLSRLTGDPVFEKVAMRAMRALWKSKSNLGLVSIWLITIYHKLLIQWVWVGVGVSRSCTFCSHIDTQVGGKKINIKR